MNLRILLLARGNRVLYNKFPNKSNYLLHPQSVRSSAASDSVVPVCFTDSQLEDNKLQPTHIKDFQTVCRSDGECVL